MKTPVVDRDDTGSRPDQPRGQADRLPERVAVPGFCLITSSAYVEQELSAEFGQLPPSFLPLGVSRLYESQLDRLADAGPIFLTLPESFQPPPHDLARLAERGVNLVLVPDGLRLGEAVTYALNVIDAPPGPLRLLHGDTLVDGVPAAMADIMAISLNGDDYSWAEVELDDERVTRLDVSHAGSAAGGARPVACGYFSFSDPASLVRAITRARGDFVQGLNLYAGEHAVAGVRVSDWLDFGHIQTYFRSRRSITTQRSFNMLSIDPLVVRKASTDHAKLRAEAAWFATLPPSVQVFAARLIEHGQADGVPFYSTEYQYAPTLAELFVFGGIGRPTWRRIMTSCAQFLAACGAVRGVGSGDEAMRILCVDKTAARLERFAADSGFDITRPTRYQGRPLPSLLTIAQTTAAGVGLASGRRATIMHGDFCFSNILYNSRAGRIVTIDPRGLAGDQTPSIFGDLRYDLAKLAHSIVGRYDHIVAGRYSFARNDSHDFSIDFEATAQQVWLQDVLGDLAVDGVGGDSGQIRAVTILLFLSMLPLHAERPDRQLAFVANALRLFLRMEGGPA
ncbi:MAG: phosphotransferase [Rhodospirillales bacterium]|nr:phosphotransferase [Rhodospirillales bacterium]MDE2198027.1 phosphotransferase [Rhodospirillales bacterium]MDE2574589.1 phosphotransferase [Rhodospirillales bacterium]